MSNTYFFSVFGTFGNPNGFRQSFGLGGNAEIAKDLKTFDLKTDAVKLFPKSKIYAIRKDYAGGCNLISYAVYTFAREQNSNRGGTFIGSSLMFIDKIGSESLIIDVLNEFHTSLQKNNVSDDVITVNHSDHFSIQKPKDFDKIGFNVRDINDLNFVQSTGKYLVVYGETNPDQLQSLFNKSIELLNTYDTIYFTQSAEIAEFVQQKGIFKIVNTEGLEKEIGKLHEDRIHAVQNSINEFEKEKEKLKEERKQLIDDLTRQIRQNEKRHQENEQKILESKNGINVINQEYDQFSKKIDEVVSILKTEGKLETARKQYNEDKRLFINKINQNKEVELLGSVSSSNTRVQGSRPGQSYGNNHSELTIGSQNNTKKKSKLDGFKIATAVLSLLLIVSYIFYFMVLYKGKITQFPL